MLTKAEVYISFVFYEQCLTYSFHKHLSDYYHTLTKARMTKREQYEKYNSSITNKTKQK